ncbi:MAG: hypothetical protein V4510_12995 [bacterium]
MAVPEGKYPLGDPQGTPRQKLLWKLGWRLVPTAEERLIGAGLMVVGFTTLIMALGELFRG